MIRSTLHATFTSLALASLALASPALAASPAELASQHIDAVATGDVGKITSQYTDRSWLSWVGGPLDGTYLGSSQIAGVWDKFAKQAPLKAAIHDMKENGNPAGTTVTADVVFQGKATIKVHYVMLYRGDKLVDEIWQIDPKLAE